MRYVIGVLFAMVFIPALGCGILLGGPPSQMYEFRDVILAGAGALLFFSTILMGMLVFGAGSKDKPRSIWRLALLCLVSFLLSLFFGFAILTAKMDISTPQDGEMSLRLRLYALMIVLFAMYALLSLLLTFILTKRHNAKLTK